MTTMSQTTERLAGAPEAYLEPEKKPSLAEARAYCKNLAMSHYENFHIATWFLPSALRPHFHSIYAYCRIADDLGDEVHDPELALRLLDAWDEMLVEVYDAPERVKHPVFIALAETIRARDIPRDPFRNLLVSFRKDQSAQTYETLGDLESYSQSSANPVGRLILYACGYTDPRMQELSDKICTALQYANFWQDVGQDVRERGRVYLPLDAMRANGVTPEQVCALEPTPQYQRMIAGLVAQTRTLFAEGALLEEMVDRQLASTLRLFRKGGEAVLDAIEAIDYETLTQRPVVTHPVKLRLLAGALRDRFLPRFA